MDAKYAIILDADPDEVNDAMRGLLALVVGLALVDQGARIEAIFDGPSVQWLARGHDVPDPLASRIADLISEARERGLSLRACRQCAERHGVYEELKAQGQLLDGRPDGHPCITPLVVAGYQILEPSTWITSIS